MFRNLKYMFINYERIIVKWPQTHTNSYGYFFYIENPVSNAGIMICNPSFKNIKIWYCKVTIYILKGSQISQHHTKFLVLTAY